MDGGNVLAVVESNVTGVCCGLIVLERESTQPANKQTQEITVRVKKYFLKPIQFNVTV